MAGKSYPSPFLYFKFKGIFDHNQVAKLIQDWMDDNAYEYHAKKYKLKADAAEYDIIGNREITEYVTFNIGVHVWFRDMKEVEVIKDGEKIKMQEGSAQFEIYASIDYDPQKRFQGSKFLQWLENFYFHYIIKQTRTDVWEDDILFKQQQILSKIKAHLGSEVV